MNGAGGFTGNAHAQGTIADRHRPHDACQSLRVACELGSETRCGNIQSWIRIDLRPETGRSPALVRLRIACFASSSRMRERSHGLMNVQMQVLALKSPWKLECE